MVKYTEIQGDLLEMFKNNEIDVMVHGANCFNIMGAGIARIIALNHPSALEVDKNFKIPVGDINRLGSYSYASIRNIEDEKRFQWIVNAYTQYQPGKNLDYNALELALKKINFAFQSERIGLPLIGCGIAGGDWRIVKKIIKRQLKDCDVTVCFLPQDVNLMESNQEDIIPVWVEGFSIQGNSGTARLLGFSKGKNFDEAVANLVPFLESPSLYRKDEQTGNHYYWGCQLFQDEIQARKSFG